MKEGLVDIAELNPAIPDEVANKIQDVRQRLKMGIQKLRPIMVR